MLQKRDKNVVYVMMVVANIKATIISDNNYRMCLRTSIHDIFNRVGVFLKEYNENDTCKLKAN